VLSKISEIWWDAEAGDMCSLGGSGPLTNAGDHEKPRVSGWRVGRHWMMHHASLWSV
jgi:hypothetical protein